MVTFEIGIFLGICRFVAFNVTNLYSNILTQLKKTSHFIINKNYPEILHSSFNKILSQMV